MTPIFRPTYWGRLSLFEFPHAIVGNDGLQLSARALKVLLVLLQIARSGQSRNRDALVQVKVGGKLLQNRCDLSKNVVTAALKELEEKLFIRRVGDQRRRRGEFGVSAYLICNPADGEPIPSVGTNFYYKQNIRYVRMPRCIAKEQSADWSLSKVSNSEIRLFVVLCWLANKHRDNRFQTDSAELKRLTRLSTHPTLLSALTELEYKHLIWVTAEEGSNRLEIVLCDPYTGEPIHEQTANPEDDPANYYVTPERGRATRLNLNSANPEQVDSFVRSLLPSGSVIEEQSNGDFKIVCPFHADQNPSCSVSPIKRCFYCFGCRRKGSINELVMKLKGVEKAEAIKLMALHGGQSAEFHQPERNIEARYDYVDKNLKLVKQVVRYPGKKFAQRQPHNGGWRWDVDGVKPILYNAHLLQYSRIVCICEGEKDCDTINNLSWPTVNVVAVTSGGADSWLDELAEELREKRVAILPDADEPGERYAAAVQESLRRREIEFRLVSFGEASAKDTTEFIQNGGTVDALIERIGRDWFYPEGTEPQTSELVEV